MLYPLQTNHKGNCDRSYVPIDIPQDQELQGQKLKEKEQRETERLEKQRISQQDKERYGNGAESKHAYANKQRREKIRNKRKTRTGNTSQKKANDPNLNLKRASNGTQLE